MAYKNIEDHIKYNREYHQKNKQKISKQKKEYYQKNKVEIRKKQKKYWQKNKDKLIKQNTKYLTNKRRTNLKYNLNYKISRVINYSLKGNKNGLHWEELVGYTLTDLQKHLQKTIPDSYTWQDFLNSDLHIDHIIPISVFNYDKPEHPDFKKCWALKNLRLLPASENLKKHNKLYKPFQPSLTIELI